MRGGLTEEVRALGLKVRGEDREKKTKELANEATALKSLISQQQNMEEFEKKIKELEATNSKLSEEVNELKAKVAEP